MPRPQQKKGTIFDGATSILDKGAKLQQFVAAQRARQLRKSDKCEWLVQQRDLSSQSLRLEAELGALTAGMEAAGADVGAFMRQCADDALVADQLLREETLACRDTVLKERAAARCVSRGERQAGVADGLATAAQAELRHVQALEEEASLLSAEIRCLRGGACEALASLPLWWAQAVAAMSAGTPRVGRDEGAAGSAVVAGALSSTGPGSRGKDGVADGADLTCNAGERRSDDPLDPHAFATSPSADEARAELDGPGLAAGDGAAELNSRFNNTDRKAAHLEVAPEDVETCPGASRPASPGGDGEGCYGPGPATRERENVVEGVGSQANNALAERRRQGAPSEHTLQADGDGGPRQDDPCGGAVAQRARQSFHGAVHEIDAACGPVSGQQEARSPSCDTARQEASPWLERLEDCDRLDPALAASEAAVDAFMICSRYPLASAKTKKVVQHAFRQLHANFLDALASVAADVKRASRAAPPQWSDAELLVFVNKRAHVLCHESAIASRQAMLQAIKRSLPSKTLAQLDEMDEFLCARQLGQAKLRQVTEKWRRQSVAVEAECVAALVDDQRCSAAHAAFAAQVVEFEVERERMLALHESERERFEAAAAAATAEARAHATKDAQQRAAIAARESERREADRAKLAQYHAGIQLERQRCEEAVLRELALHSQGVRERCRQNAPRVRYRRRLEECKREGEKAKQATLALEAAAREARLERIRSLVEVRVESDPARVLQPTLSLASEPSNCDPAFRPVHGYNVRQITSDRRFRVSERLHQTGIAASEYARQVMNQMHFGTTPRRMDSLTSAQQEGHAAPRFT